MLKLRLSKQMNGSASLNYILITIFFLTSIAVLGQVKDESRSNISKPRVTTKVTTPKKSSPPKAAYAHLLVSTDVDIKVSVNFSKPTLIKASDYGKKLPLEQGDNVIKVIPVDGGDYGYSKTIDVDKKGNRVFDINLGEASKEYKEKLSAEKESSLEKIKRDLIGRSTTRINEESWNFDDYSEYVDVKIISRNYNPRYKTMTVELEFRLIGFTTRTNYYLKATVDYLKKGNTWIMEEGKIEASEYFKVE